MKQSAGNGSGAGRPAAGDLAAVLLEHRERLYRAAVFLCGGQREAARELLQETLAAACGAWAGFRGRAQPYTYLYRIMLNTRCRLLRRGRRQAGWLPLEAAGEPAARADNPLEALLAGERRARVRRAVLSLPPAYQVVVTLRYLEQLSCRETAACLGLPEGTVRSRLFKARRLLARRLGVAGERAANPGALTVTETKGGGAR